MKQNFFWLGVAALGLVALVEAQVAHDLTLRVIDDIGRPLVGAEATIKFLEIGGKDVNSGPTDEKGEFRAGTKMSLGTFLNAEKAGHYPARVDNTGNFFFYIPQGTATVPLVLPRVLNPIAMHVLRVDYLKLPAQNEWLGYDLEAADFVPPHGKGKTADICFRFENEFLGFVEAFKDIDKEREIVRGIKTKRGEIFSEEEFRRRTGKWRGGLQVSFPGEKEGVVTEAERYWFYSQLRLPHHAPEEGYAPSLRFERTVGILYGNPQPKLVGYYLRTRVKLDQQGNIVSANYAKIYDEIRFDPRGSVSFWYYFNPTPNDRNLEFDPTKNLFPADFPGANVSDP